MPRWVWVFYGALALVAIANLLVGDTSALTPTMWLLPTTGSLLVGFNEELATGVKPARVRCLCAS